MARICTICGHHKRGEIDGALLRSEALRNVAKQFGTSAAALHRHKNKCIPVQLAKAQQVSEVSTASALIKELRELTRKTGAVLTRALRRNQAEVALKAIARLEKQLELKARMLGQLEDRGGTQTTVQVVYVDKLALDRVNTPPQGGNGVASVLDISHSAKQLNAVRRDDHSVRGRCGDEGESN